MIKSISIISIVFFVFIAAIPSQAAVRVGDVAPDFTLVDTNGNQFNLASKKGNVIVLFWMGFS